MAICILDNDRLEGPLAARWHSYGAMTARLLREAGWAGRTEVFAACEGQCPPEGARFDAVLRATSAHCPVAAYAVGTQVLAVQPHPEFDADYAAALIEARRARFAPERVAERLESLRAGHDGLAFGRLIVRFVEQGL